MIISASKFREIVWRIQSHKGSKLNLEAELAEEYELPKNTISSIISNENKKKMKKNHYKVTSNALKFYDRYLNMKEGGQDCGIILKIAHELDVPYTFVAKIILEKYFEQKSELSGNKVLNLKLYLKDSTCLDDKDLAHEVFLCQLYDNQYGNINDIIRHSLGQEYEYYLRAKVKEKQLTFQTEDELRRLGYDKTPDIKLNIPFAVDGFVVNWIESKALFADEEEHQNYVKDQYLSYWNRFGTGLVIYWLGMVDTIIDSSEKRFIVRTDFPENITLIDPFIVSETPRKFKIESAPTSFTAPKQTNTVNQGFMIPNSPT